MVFLCFWFCLGFYRRSVIWEDYLKIILGINSGFPRQGASVDQGVPFSQWKGLQQNLVWHNSGPDRSSNKFPRALNYLVFSSQLCRIPPKRKAGTYSQTSQHRVDYFSLHWQSDYPSYLWIGNTAGNHVSFLEHKPTMCPTGLSIMKEVSGDPCLLPTLVIYLC